MCRAEALRPPRMDGGVGMDWSEGIAGGEGMDGGVGMDGSEGEGGCRDVYSGELGYIVCSDDLSALTINLLRRYCGDRSRLEPVSIGGRRRVRGRRNASV